MQNSIEIKFSFLNTKFSQKTYFLFSANQKKRKNPFNKKNETSTNRDTTSSQHDAYNTTLAAGLNSKILSRFDLTTGIYVP